MTPEKINAFKSTATNIGVNIESQKVGSVIIDLGESSASKTACVKKTIADNGLQNLVQTTEVEWIEDPNDPKMVIDAKVVLATDLLNLGRPPDYPGERSVFHVLKKLLANDGLIIFSHKINKTAIPRNMSVLGIDDAGMQDQDMFTYDPKLDTFLELCRTNSNGAFKTLFV